MVRIIEKRKLLRKKAAGLVKMWAKGLKFKSTVILHGSYARGDFNFWSDIDVILIAETNKPVHKRLEDIDYPSELEIVFLTPLEFLKLLEKKEPYIIEAMEKGIIIKDDFNISDLIQSVVKNKK